MQKETPLFQRRFFWQNIPVFSSLLPFSESDTRAKLIDPALKEAGWNEDGIVREYYFTAGRKLMGGMTGKRHFVDYLLRHKNINLAIIEAKKQSEEPTEGLQQAIDYAEKLHIPFVYSTNGDALYEYGLKTGKGEYKNRYPTPEELHTRIFSEQEEWKEKLLSEPFHSLGAMRPRYYQEIAVNKVMENISKEEKRILLTLATGTGKTFIAFQIVWKLFQARWNLEKNGNRPRILFLADRNILVDQAMNTFNPMENDMVKVTGEEVKKRGGKVPTNANVFFAIYQAISERKGSDTEDIPEEQEESGYYKQYPKDFFDAVIIDECHRGAANEEGSWRAILEHFSNAVHIGLTATPKREDNVDTYQYFGKPVYEYSLKDGINDGFLTPYKVKRIRTNLDEYVYTHGDTLVDGELTKDLYEMSDFNRTIRIPELEELRAQAILQNIETFDKTIIFCVDQKHALMVRDMINKYKKVSDPHYCVRVTSNDGLIGRGLLEQFQDNDKTIPVILTSSQMLTTGVDAKNVRNIVLLRTINSMVEFKQIIGRGTRTFEGKDFFTILDFTGATKLFYDEAWDGGAEEIVETHCNVSDVENEDEENQEQNQKLSVPEKEEERIYGEEKPERPKPATVQLSNGRKLKVIDVETRYIDESGKPLTATEFLEKILGKLPDLYTTEEQLRTLWANPESRKKLMEDLAEAGFAGEQMEALQTMFDAQDSDIFDVLAHLSFEKEVVKRETRAKSVSEDFFDHYEDPSAKEFLHFVLRRYTLDGVMELSPERMGGLIKLSRFRTPRDAGKPFGGVEKLKQAFYAVQEELYKVL